MDLMLKTLVICGATTKTLVWIAKRSYYNWEGLEEIPAPVILATNSQILAEFLWAEGT